VDRFLGSGLPAALGDRVPDQEGTAPEEDEGQDGDADDEEGCACRTGGVVHGW
jgi:hypothetical protein